LPGVQKLVKEDGEATSDWGKGTVTGFPELMSDQFHPQGRIRSREFALQNDVMKNVPPPFRTRKLHSRSSRYKKRTMDLTSSMIGAAVLILTVSLALVVWFLRHRAGISETRMARMMLHNRVDPEVATESIMREARSRCVRCRSKAWCDKWFAGKVDGDNSFCPNVETFRSLAAASGPCLLMFWPAPKDRGM
jgi:hypothetical protein